MGLGFFPPGQGIGNIGLTSGDCDQVVRVGSVLELAKSFEVFIFSIHGTLVSDRGSAAMRRVLVPKLRKMGKRVALFSTDFGVRRRDLALVAAHHCLSFSRMEILLTNDLGDINQFFPFDTAERILMITADPVHETNLGRELGFKVCLLQSEEGEQSPEFGVWPHFISKSI